jgi:outer membrane receptor for ferrienterochelin and colicins
MKKNIAILFLIFISKIFSQEKTTLFGYVSSNGDKIENINIKLNTGLLTKTDSLGYYEFVNLPLSTYTIEVSGIAFKTTKKSLNLTFSKQYQLDFDLTNFQNNLDEVVITGTKTFKRKTKSPVVVNILDSKGLNNLQVCNLSEGLKFQPGLRVETDCQTCNYTQLRMNGLAGGYSQILINGRPIFSPLMGLYGMEQLPVNMIDRIEVIRGGGSSLYGSSAIGGTVNVITKIPKKDAFELNSSYQNINNQTNDYNFNGNATIVSESKKAGISFFMNRRERDFYDANNDNFSEIPKIENTSIGTTFYIEPTDNQKIELSLSNLNEYRFGGEMVDKPTYLTQQSEERKHKIGLGSLDYQINFNDDKTSFISYAAWQNTDRKHYTGIFPDTEPEIQNHLENPPYGISSTTTLQGGFQINHKLSNFIKGTNVLTFGSEYLSDKVLDEIQSFNYLVDQHTKDFGTFFQSDWEIVPSLNLLSGIRMDDHNLISKILFSP